MNTYKSSIKGARKEARMDSRNEVFVKGCNLWLR